MKQLPWQEKKAKSTDGWERQPAGDGQRQIAWVMTIDRLSHTLKHKRGNLAMWPSGAQIIYQIESVPFLNVTSCLAITSPRGQDNINGEHCPQTAEIKPQARRTGVISLTYNTHPTYIQPERMNHRRRKKVMLQDVVAKRVKAITLATDYVALV